MKLPSTPEEALKNVLWEAAYDVTFAVAPAYLDPDPAARIIKWAEMRAEMLRLHEDACQAVAGNPPFYLRPARYDKGTDEREDT